jgi:putative MFS transporter
VSVSAGRSSNSTPETWPSAVDVTDGDRSLLSAFENAPLTQRYWCVYGLVTLQICCELFDFIVVGFLLVAVASQWHLTFGQSTIILLSAGVGAVAGAPLFGWWGDRFGRRPAILAGSLVYCGCAAGVSLIPDGSWILFALLRFMVGVGYAGAGANQFALIVELTPTRHRTLLTSGLGLPASLGVVAASVIVAVLYPLLGWRGTAALGLLPVVVGIVLVAITSESPRWLLANGFGDRARAAVARMMMRAVETLPAAPARLTESRIAPPVRELFRDGRRFWLVVGTQIGLGATLSGVLLWGPGIFAQLLNASPADAAKAFLLVSLSGFIGRAAFAYLPHRVGRVRAGVISGVGGAVFLALAALLHDQHIGILALFPLLIACGQFFYDGGYSNLNPYPIEVYPIRIAALGGGLAAAAGGIGKIVGPLVLGLIAGVNNLVTPQATQDAILPGFLFLAGCSLLAGLTFWSLGIETHRKALRLD